MTRFQRNALLASAAAVLLATALFAAGTGLSELWIRFEDGTIQTTAAHNCVNPDDPADVMIRVGGVCIDKYEASIWTESDGGGIQLGVTGDDYTTVAGCSDNGQDCFGKIYARSVEGVPPSAFITWFQAAAALANSGKRLPHNIEWQQAVQGTPDPGNSPDPEDCNTNSAGPEVTGGRENCVSAWGAHDMVGNLWEWVADWMPRTSCSSWPAGYGDDVAFVLCGTGSNTSTGTPSALIRGGTWSSGSDAGPFAVNGGDEPLESSFGVGLRGAR